MYEIKDSINAEIWKIILKILKEHLGDFLKNTIKLIWDILKALFPLCNVNVTSHYII